MIVNQLNVFLNWFGNVSTFQMLLFWCFLLFSELVVKLLLDDTSKKSRHLLFNLWEVFGLFVPVFWLLRVSEKADPTYLEILLAGAMGLYYGLYKPLRTKNKRG